MYSPTGTIGSTALEGGTNAITDNNIQSDKVVYAAPAQIVTVPHQTSATGDLYAVSTKAAQKPGQEQQPSGESNDAPPDTIKANTQGVSSS